MNKNLFVGIVGLGVLIFASCSKSSSPAPSLASSRATLLAGNSGSSKSWHLISITEFDKDVVTNQTATGTWTLTDIAACQADNVFKFTNNSTQDYQQSEGASSCNLGGGTPDPTILEKGSWALTNDGKNLIIDAIVNVTNTQLQNEDDGKNYFLFYFLLNQGVPFTINTITSTSLNISYSSSFTDSSTGDVIDYTITLTLAAQ